MFLQEKAPFSVIPIASPGELLRQPEDRDYWKPDSTLGCLVLCVRTLDIQSSHRLRPVLSLSYVLKPASFLLSKVINIELGRKYI